MFAPSFEAMTRDVPHALIDETILRSDDPSFNCVWRHDRGSAAVATAFQGLFSQRRVDWVWELELKRWGSLLFRPS